MCGSLFFNLGIASLSNKAFRWYSQLDTIRGNLDHEFITVSRCASSYASVGVLAGLICTWAQPDRFIGIPGQSSLVSSEKYVILCSSFRRKRKLVCPKGRNNVGLDTQYLTLATRTAPSETFSVIFLSVNLTDGTYFAYCLPGSWECNN